MDPGESSNAPAAEELAASQGQSQKHLLLPKSTINDLMKSSLPHYAKTANPARELVQSCVTEFIMFVTGEYAQRRITSLVDMDLYQTTATRSIGVSCSISPSLTLRFTLFQSIRASDICKKKDKKTIGGEDVITALRSLGFDDYIEPLKLYLEKYRQVRSRT
jgi:nuclear transcription Y subunit beta